MRNRSSLQGAAELPYAEPEEPVSTPNLDALLAQPPTPNLDALLQEHHDKHLLCGVCHKPDCPLSHWQRAMGREVNPDSEADRAELFIKYQVIIT